MTIQFRMTVEEYKAFCQEFLNKFNNEQLNEQIAKMTIPEFQEWLQKMSEDYYETYSPVKELLKIIRGDYDPSKDYDSDKEDPLDIEENRAFFVQYRDVHGEVYHDYMESLSAYNQKMKDLEQYHNDQEQERLLNIEVDGKEYKAIKVISVFWSGWECDQYAWLVKEGDETRLVTSNHGSKNFTDKSFLENKIAEYKQAIVETEDMLSLLKQ